MPEERTCETCGNKENSPACDVGGMCTATSNPPLHNWIPIDAEAPETWIDPVEDLVGAVKQLQVKFDELKYG